MKSDPPKPAKKPKKPKLIFDGNNGNLANGNLEGLLKELENNPTNARALQINKILEAAAKYYKTKKEKLAYEELNGSLVQLKDVEKAFFEGWQIVVSSFDGWAISMSNELQGENRVAWADMIKKSLNQKLKELQDNFLQNKKITK